MDDLHVDSIAKSYGNKPLLSDVFLSCNMGEVVGILGRNGCGKSTLLKIIYGAEASENRFVRIGDKVLQSVSDTKRLIGFLPQEGFLPKGLKINTLVRFFLPKEARNVLYENDFLKTRLKKNTHNLSGGEKRIIEVLLIAHSPSKFLLLDEPFKGVSPLVREELIKILHAHKKEKGMLITDHDYESVLKVADNVVLLKDGSTKKINDRRELVASGYLSGSDQGVSFPK